MTEREKERDWLLETSWTMSHVTLGVLVLMALHVYCVYTVHLGLLYTAVIIYKGEATIGCKSWLLQKLPPL